MKKKIWKKATGIGAAVILSVALVGCSAPANANIIEKIDRVDDVIEERIEVSEDKIEAAIEGKIESVTVPSAKAAGNPATKLTKDEAKEIALKHAGVSDVTWVKVEFEEGRYEVDFKKDGFEYDYEIGAESGKIFESRKERDDDYKAPAEQQPVKEESPKKETAKASESISKDKAKEIALKHAGVSDVTWVKVEFDDGKYEVDFKKDGYEYEYDINAKNGSVIKSEKERDDDNRAPKQEPAKEEAPKQETGQTTELIGKDKAKSIALKHAGVSGADRVKVELDDGKYEVDFRKDGYEYDYEIGAKSGKVIKAEKERDND